MCGHSTPFLTLHLAACKLLGFALRKACFAKPRAHPPARGRGLGWWRMRNTPYCARAGKDEVEPAGLQSRLGRCRKSERRSGKRSNARASYFASRFVAPLFGNPEGAAAGGRLLLLTFLGETRKVSGCRAAPGNAPRKRKPHQLANQPNKPKTDPSRNGPPTQSPQTQPAIPRPFPDASPFKNHSARSAPSALPPARSSKTPAMSAATTPASTPKSRSDSAHARSCPFLARHRSPRPPPAR